MKTSPNTKKPSLSKNTKPFFGKSAKEASPANATEVKTPFFAPPAPNRIMRNPKPKQGQATAGSPPEPDYVVGGYASEAFEPTKAQKEKIKGIAGSIFMKPRQAGRKIRIVGHTDKPGTPKFNLNLGMKRAEMVKAELLKDLKSIHKTIDPNFSVEIITTSAGEPDKGPEKHNSKLRKVSIYIIAPKPSAGTKPKDPSKASKPTPKDKEAKKPDTSRIKVPDPSGEERGTQSKTKAGLEVIVTGGGGILGREATALIEGRILAALEGKLKSGDHKQQLSGKIELAFSDAKALPQDKIKLLAAREYSLKLEVKYKRKLRGESKIYISTFYKEAAASDTKKKEDKPSKPETARKRELGAKVGLTFKIKPFEFDLAAQVSDRKKAGKPATGVGGVGAVRLPLAENWFLTTSFEANHFFSRKPDVANKTELRGTLNLEFRFKGL